MATFPHWREQLLGALGGRPGAEVMRFLDAWQRAEGGTAHFNPLNTTMRVPGSTRYNSALVQNYPDDLAGIAATILTLRLHYYRNLVAGLRSTHVDAESILRAARTDLATWGTGSKVIAQLLAEPR